MERATTTLEPMFAELGINVTALKLYRHSYGVPQKAWAEGPDAFLYFVQFQNKGLFSTRMRYIAHFLPEQTEDGRHASRYIGTSEMVGGWRKVTETDAAHEVYSEFGPKAADVGDADVGEQRWLIPPHEDPMSNELWIDMGTPRRAVWASDYPCTFLSGAHEISASAAFPESRVWRSHTSLERRVMPAAVVKAHRGLICEGCGLDAKKRFGDLANRVIEAHHLTPVAAMPEEGREVTVSDFAVLCATCHRLIHGLERLDDLGPLRTLVRRGDP